MNIEDVIFVGGSGRSGTTLICQLLDIHSEAASIFEVWTLITLLKSLREDRLPNELDYENIEYSLSSASRYNWRIRKEEASYALSEKVGAALKAAQPLCEVIRQWTDYLHYIQMTRDGSTRIIHKTPALATYLSEIWRLWPSARFLHMIRDPRDVIASYLDQDWGPTDIKGGIEWYCERVGPAIACGRGDARYMEVKMEDMIENPRDILDQIQQWAGLVPETERMLAQMHIYSDIADFRKNQLDRKASRWIYEEAVRRIPALGEMYDL